ncbi:hypothetical protein ACFFNY_09920 [Paenibacillus hodogayensis]|uniref:CBS domain-containing protein n=1 Tax=Paenibacillus hodogayensis TaxID=279208 RepID=A0ABV5VUC1_9BACL
MEQIVPITEEVCSRFVGFPVCAVLNDGTRHYGIISRVRSERLVLNDTGDDPESTGIPRRSKGKNGASTTARNRKSRKSGQKTGTARLSAFPNEEAVPQSPIPSLFGEKVSLDLANIAALFPLL